MRGLLLGIEHHLVGFPSFMQLMLTFKRVGFENIIGGVQCELPESVQILCENDPAKKTLLAQSPAGVLVEKIPQRWPQNSSLENGIAQLTLG